MWNIFMRFLYLRNFVSSFEQFLNLNLKGPRFIGASESSWDILNSWQLFLIFWNHWTFSLMNPLALMTFTWFFRKYLKFNLVIIKNFKTGSFLAFRIKLPAIQFSFSSQLIWSFDGRSINFKNFQVNYQQKHTSSSS